MSSGISRSKPYQRSLGIAAALLMFVAASGAARSGDGLPFIAEAEDFVAYNDLGGYAILAVSCAVASQDTIVQGLDRPGEWIELSVPFEDSGFYKIEIGIQGFAGMNYDFRVTLFGAGPAGEDLRTEFQLTGAGIG